MCVVLDGTTNVTRMADCDAIGMRSSQSIYIYIHLIWVTTSKCGLETCILRQAGRKRRVTWNHQGRRNWCHSSFCCYAHTLCRHQSLCMFDWWYLTKNFPYVRALCANTSHSIQPSGNHTIPYTLQMYIPVRLLGMIEQFRSTSAHIYGTIGCVIHPSNPRHRIYSPKSHHTFICITEPRALDKKAILWFQNYSHTTRSYSTHDFPPPLLICWPSHDRISSCLRAKFQVKGKWTQT